MITTQSCLVKLTGMWFFCDAIFSLCLYVGKPEERWLKNHAVRLIRLVMGIALMILG